MSTPFAYIFKHRAFAQTEGFDFVFYDTFCELCETRGLTPSGAAAKIGFNRASVTVWKNTGKAPKQDLLLKIADYFGVTTDYLLTGEEKAPADDGERKVSEEDIKLALFGGNGEVTDEMWDEALFAVEMIKERYKRKKEKD